MISRDITTRLRPVAMPRRPALAILHRHTVPCLVKKPTKQRPGIECIFRKSAPTTPNIDSQNATASFRLLREKTSFRGPARRRIVASCDGASSYRAVSCRHFVRSHCSIISRNAASSYRAGNAASSCRAVTPQRRVLQYDIVLSCSTNLQYAYCRFT